MSESHKHELGSWAVGIFSSRESPTVLWRTVRAARESCGDVDSVIDVLINGNRNLADEFAQLAAAEGKASRLSVRLRVWSFAIADKSVAWNTYVYDLLPAVDFAFFIDGYAEVERNALGQLEAALERNTHALAASGVPTMGPSARRLQTTMKNEGGIHGNLYALRGSAIERLRDSRFKLPRGLYRTDGVLGAALCFNLDPGNDIWESRRIAVVPGATWRYEAPSPWKWRDWNALLKRRLRQAQGDAENCAVRRLFSVERKPVDSIPATAESLVRQWCSADPREAGRLFRRRPLTWVACHRLLHRTGHNAEIQAPVLLYSSEHS